MSGGARWCGGHGGLMVRRVGAIVLGVALVSVGSGTLAEELASPQPISTDALRHELQAALADARQDNSVATLDALQAIISAPAFANLATSEQHTALAEAANRAARLKRNGDAESLASRAVALPEQSIYDWRTRSVLPRRRGALRSSPPRMTAAATTA